MFPNVPNFSGPCRPVSGLPAQMPDTGDQCESYSCGDSWPLLPSKNRSLCLPIVGFHRDLAAAAAATADRLLRGHSQMRLGPN